MNQTTVDIEHYSDVLCVWAYIAQARLIELRSNLGDQVRINYRFLKVFGDVHGKIASQWGNRGGLSGYATHVQEIAAGFEHLQLHPEVWLRNTPTSSLPAHLMLCGVRALALEDPQRFPQQLVEDFLIQLRTAFFVEVLDVSARQQLLEVAERAGLPVAELERVLNSGAAHAQLAADLTESARCDVKASPTMIFNEGRQTLAGNVGYRVIEANVRELLRSPGEQQSWC
jgi:predicted DsbA family dithiol-disulfide isomerase